MKDSSLPLTKIKRGDLVRLSHVSRQELTYVGIILSARKAQASSSRSPLNYLVHIDEGSFTFFSDSFVVELLQKGKE